MNIPKTASQWACELERLGEREEVLQERIETIRLIQREAYQHAAEIASSLQHSKECKDDWSITRSGAFHQASQSILAAMPK